MTFAERVNNIDVDVFHRVAELQLAPGQSSTFFLQTLNTWQDINFTAQFTRLCAELKPFVDNLPLLLHHKEQVIGILLKYIDLHAKGFEIVDDAAPDRSDEQVGGDQLSFLGERAVSGGKKHHHVDSGAHLASNLKQKAGKHGKRRGGDADGDGDGDGDGGGSGMAQKRRHRRGDQVTILASDGVTKLRKIHSTATAIKPLLELVAALARDLQDEFYVYFPRVLSALMELIDPQDPNLLELVFSCIGMIFKCLHRLMLDDMPNVFTLYRSFLFTERVSGARKSFIRNFAAETFSFLLRKIKSRHRLTSLLDFMLQSVTAQDLAVDQSIAIDGLSRLFFQTIKVHTHTYIHARQFSCSFTDSLIRSFVDSCCREYNDNSTRISHCSSACSYASCNSLRSTLTPSSASSRARGISCAITRVSITRSPSGSASLKSSPMRFRHGSSAVRHTTKPPRLCRLLPPLPPPHRLCEPQESVLSPHPRHRLLPPPSTATPRSRMLLELLACGSIASRGSWRT